MVQILDAIDDAVSRGRVVYVHCWGGVGRTGTVAGCWLRRHGAGPGEAGEILRRRWTTVAKSTRMLASAGAPPTAELVESLGKGWVAEEALAIAVYCVLAARGEFVTGVRLAVNHTGDSDSTGAICGNILGTALGVDAIPAPWVERVEARDVILQMADDLVTAWREGEDWMERYPPN